MVERLLEVKDEVCQSFSLPRFRAWLSHQSLEKKAEIATLRRNVEDDAWWDKVAHLALLMLPVVQLLASRLHVLLDCGRARGYPAARPRPLPPACLALSPLVTPRHLPVSVPP